MSVSTAYADLVILKLDSDLPAGITIPKLAPTNLASLVRAGLIPAVATMSGANANVGDLGFQDTSYGQFTIYKPRATNRAAAYAATVGGNSGSWVGMIADDTAEPITLGVMNSGTSYPDVVMGGGYFVGTHLTEINAMITEVGAEGHSVNVWAP